MHIVNYNYEAKLIFIHVIFSKTYHNVLFMFQVVDSMGRLPSPGLLEGLTSDFGDFDECLDSRTPEHMRKQFEGKYCLLNIKLPIPWTSTLTTTVQLITNSLNTTTWTSLTRSGHWSTYFTLLMAQSSILVFVCHRCALPMKSVLFSTRVILKYYFWTLNNNFIAVLYPVTNIPVDVDRKCYAKSEPVILDKFQLGSM